MTRGVEMRQDSRRSNKACPRRFAYGVLLTVGARRAQQFPLTGEIRHIPWLPGFRISKEGKRQRAAARIR